MRILKRCMPLGMVSTILFFAMTILGQILRPDYNPIKQYISDLFADGAPYADLMKLLAYTSFALLVVFALCMAIISFKKYKTALKLGFSALLSMATISTIGYGMFPLTAYFPLTPKNVMHVVITISIIIITIIAMVLVSYGWLKQDGLRKLGKISSVCSIGFILFNIFLLIAVFNLSNVQGLLERLSIYTFYIFIFVVSRRYAKLSLTG